MSLNDKLLKSAERTLGGSRTCRSSSASSAKGKLKVLIDSKLAIRLQAEQVQRRQRRHKIGAEEAWLRWQQTRKD